MGGGPGYAGGVVAGGGHPGGTLPAGTDVGNLLQWNGTLWIPVLAPTGDGQITFWNQTTKLWTLAAAPAADGNIWQWDNTIKKLVPVMAPVTGGTIINWDNGTKRWVVLAPGTIGNTLTTTAAGTVAWKDNRDQLPFGASNTNNTTSSRYLHPWQDNVTSPSSVEAAMSMLMSRPGTINAAFSNYRGGALAVANTVYKVRLSTDNGATFADTTVTWSVAATVRIGSDVAHSFTFAAGNLISVQETLDAADATASFPAVSLAVTWG